MFKLSIICTITLGLFLQACGEPSRFETACVNFAPWASQMSKSKQEELCSCMDDYRSELSDSY